VNIKQVLRDWWRGYSEADVLSVCAKLKRETRPGAVIPITQREEKALRDPRTWGRGAKR
jgi:hypothetical protein